MRDIPASAVTAAVKALCVPANNQLPPDVEAAVRGAYKSEPWPIAKQTLGTLCQNLDAARATGLPICQDTGMACVFAEIGQDVHITAAFAAGTMGDMLDWEDCSGTGHSSAGVIPTAVIAAEVLKKSGKDLLTAVVAEYEVYQRVALAGDTNIVGFNIFACLF